jgi:hypothetical protein
MQSNYEGHAAIFYNDDDKKYNRVMTRLDRLLKVLTT